VASCCECGNEPWGSGATELGVSSRQRLVFLRDTYVEDGRSSLLLCIPLCYFHYENTVNIRSLRIIL
jgi:hypothetical protein